MTTIVISNKFWNTLTEAQQEAFHAAALVASRKEREWSIQDAQNFEEQAQANGVTITEINNEERELLKKKSQMTYVKCKYLFSDNLVSRIRKTVH